MGGPKCQRSYSELTLCEEAVFQKAWEFHGQPALHMMPNFGSILVLLLAKTLAQEDLGPIFKAVGETLELGFCFGVDYIAVYKVNDGEKQLFWNSSYSVPPPDAYKNRLNAFNRLNGLLGVQVMDLKLSDSGVYLRECWDGGKISNQHTNYLYMCDEKVLDELFSPNGGGFLDCDVSYSEQDSTKIKWFREVYPGSKISLFLDTEKSKDPLQEELNNVIQVQDKGFSLYISNAVLELSKKFFCLVIMRGQCKSFKTIHLPERNKTEMHLVYYAVGEEAALSCMSEQLNQQQRYWKTPFGEVGASMPHSQMYVSASEGNRDHVLVIPSITLNHNGEYKCLSNLVVVEYYVTVCPELVSNNAQSFSGGEIILTCSLTTDESVNILWYRQRDLLETQLIYDSEDPSIDLHADMVGRTNITNPSLIISDLNEKDTGTYWCVVLLVNFEQGFDKEDDNMYDELLWMDEAEMAETAETCIIKEVTHLKIQPNNLKRGFDVESSQNHETEPESSPVQYAIIGGVLGIVILGLIIAVVVVKMKTKRKDLDSSKAEPREQQKVSAVSAPLMSL